MTAVIEQRCANCGDVIGRLETPAIWHGNVVCAVCHAKLQRTESLQLPPLATVVKPVMPPPLPPPVYPRGIDEEVLRAATGQTEIRTVAQALDLLGTAKRAYSKARSDRLYAVFSLVLRHLRLTEARCGITPSIDATIVAAVPTVPAMIFLIVAAPLSMPLLLTLLAAFYGVAAVLAFGLFCDRSTETDGTRRAVREAEHDRAAGELARANERFATAVAELKHRRVLYEAIDRAAKSDVNKLLHTNVGLLDGTGFERFLAAVFQANGYAVLRIGRTGDQGTDLIVQKNGARIAVQAKRYSSSVGNDAVQEAHAGRSFHHCERCCVVTNSHFTPAAIALAREVNCVLIDGQHLPLLIRNRIHV